MSVQWNSLLCSCVWEHSKCSPRATYFPGTAALSRKFPGTGLTWIGGAARRQCHARGCFACCLPSGSNGGSRQIFPARRTVNEAEWALWNWLPGMDLSHTAHSPHLWFHGSLLSQKLQQEGAALPSSLCPLWEISDISQEWKSVLSTTLQAWGTWGMEWKCQCLFGQQKKFPSMFSSLKYSPKTGIKVGYPSTLMIPSRLDMPFGVLLAHLFGIMWLLCLCLDYPRSLMLPRAMLIICTPAFLAANSSVFP